MNKFIKIFFVIVAFGVGLIFMKINKDMERVLYFSTSSKPFSSDPMDYDYYAHHYAFTSVFAGLISLEQKGSIAPILAEKWSHDADFRTWGFDIRRDLFYSNGEKITTKDIAQNFKRIAYLKNLSKSKSGVLEFLIGFDSLKSASDDIEGISTTGNQLILKFKKGMPDLLYKISFGFYSLAHPSLYHPLTGEWINKKNVISSGAYEVVDWTDKSFKLKLRKNVPYMKYADSIQNITFTDLLEVKNKNDLKNTDMIVADKNSLMVDDEAFEYIGSSVGLKIGYMHLYGWKNKSALKDVNVRRWLRSKFYEGLERNGFSPTQSFFPLSLKGLSLTSKKNLSIKPNFKEFELVTHTMNQSMKLLENNQKKSVAEIFGLALDNMNTEGVKLKKMDISDDESNLKDFDLVINGTGVESSDYWDTIRFMFLSKHGIQLPDESGIILKEIEKASPDINVINNELWEQAIIWPIRHYTNGFWFKKDSLINYDEINLDSPAINFQFFKWN